ncbi:uncharacterized protein LOC112056307 [Bicyclus anynana]|uniref:Mediator of DNA damage checkpoint protein 1 n=1 Tax=Bicyclus anynana TaxID=110368 RepID=A0ABM3LSW2_BICAN|nr:uncharacterized protein LOC112056307 [Bicyclus anynana]
MELTQRLECTQELYFNNSEKSYPDQIGFLGICGDKYPLNKGPNKIGRDPGTCNIVLDLNSISRQHAVINILNCKEFMLMDLDSANKTKLSGKTLQPYLPLPLKNGDMIQFGDIFGVFRLLKEENELPLTQAVDIPDTPVQNRHISKINIHATTIPESPEVSDKDDSFIATSQQKPKNIFKSPNDNYIKSSGKTIAIKPVGTSKIDNVFWSSSKKSDSFTLCTQSNDSRRFDESVISPRNSKTLTNEQSIFDMDTQIPNDNISKEIYELDTQIPHENGKENVDCIYNASTQIVNPLLPEIYEMETQLPTEENLPEICKLQEQENLKLNLCVDNKENDNNINNAETQVILNEGQILPKDIFNAETQAMVGIKVLSPKVKEIINIKSKLASANNVSDDKKLFDEIDNHPLEHNFESQQLLSPKFNTNEQLDDEEDAYIPESQIIQFVPQKRVNRIESDSSTDCEDINIAATQIIPKITDDNLTDCEDESNNVIKEKKNQRKSPDIDDDSTDCEFNEDDLFKQNTVVQKESFNNQPTQTSGNAKIDTGIANQTNKSDNFEDLQTQIIEENKPTRTEPHRQSTFSFEEALTQQIGSEEIIQFKFPFQSSVKKIKETENLSLNKSNTAIKHDEKYYAATQDLFDDLPDDKIEKNNCDLRDDDVIKTKRAVQNDLFEGQSTHILEHAKLDTGTADHSICNNFEDLQTQIIEENEYTQSKKAEPERRSGLCFEEALTQQIYSEEVVQFKVPLQSSVKKKKKIDENLNPNKSNTAIVIDDDDDDEKYYAATQDILDDLCSQKPLSPDDKIIEIDENQSVENKTTFTKVSPRSSTESSDVEEKIYEFVSNLTCSQIEDVVGVEKQVTVLQRIPSDKSDILVTPKKIDCVSILEIELPNTQEIKSGISLIHNSDTESLPDHHSESGNDSENNSPVKLKHKPKSVQKIRINLSDKFDPETIPVRSSTRIRKPTSKMLNCDDVFQNTAENILNQVSAKNQNVKDDKLKESNDKKSYRKEKSYRSKTKIEDQAGSSNSRARNRHHVDENDSKKTITDNSEKKESKRGRKAKQMDEVILDSKEKTVDNTNSSTSRSTRNKRKLDQNTGSDSKSRKTKSKSPEKDKHRLDVKNKNNQKHAEERSESQVIVKRRKSTKERSKSPEMTRKRKPTEERPSSSETEKSAKNRSKSPKLEKNKTETRSSEKSRASKDTEVRRSTRNRSKKSGETSNMKHEESKVYSIDRISSDTSTNSPIKQKRPATCELDVPNAKKPKNGENQNVTQTQPKLKSILRATPARKTKTQHVLFTAFPNEEVQDKLQKLGAVIVSDVMSCTVVLTLEIKRTFKLLCAVGLGKPIVGPNWVQACADTNMIVDPWLYLLQDAAAERKFRFNLQHTLVGRREFLKGYSVSSTPSVLPAAKEMKLIVECSGGKWEEGGRNWVCLSTPGDRALWAGLRRRGATIVTSEFVLGGVLRQAVDIEGNML